MSAAPSDAAAPAPGEKKAARLPGWRGHHKLYLAAAALVAVCVWLIVWLVVFGKVLPGDIVGFAAIVLSERGEREKRFYGDGKGERRRTAF